MALPVHDPRCYMSSSFELPRITDGFDVYCVPHNKLELQTIRKQERIAELCFLYDYCHGVLNQGIEPDTTYVEDEYIRLMGQMQEAMRDYVNNKGI